MITQNKETQSQINPDRAVELLLNGNSRFVNEQMVSRNYLQQVRETQDGQHPFAAVLSCIDSRVPIETIFDQGIGDVFSVRIAGNFVNDNMLGSLEFSCKVAGSKVVMVLGHSGCGAVKGACDGVKLGKITGMLNNIMPAVDAVSVVDGPRDSSNAEFVQKVVEKNVALAVQDIRNQSEVLREMERAGEVKIVGAVYSVATGAVKLL